MCAADSSASDSARRGGRDAAAKDARRLWRYARRESSGKLRKLLRKRGAALDVNSRDAAGDTALHHAARRGARERVGDCVRARVCVGAESGARARTRQKRLGVVR